MKEPTVCVVVATKDRWDFTKRFLESFKQNSYKNYQIVIVDDASKDGTPELLTDDYPEVIVIKGNGNLWWSGATNLGVKYALKNNFDYVLTINNDAVIQNKEYLKSLIKCSKENNNAIVGSLILKSTDKKIYSIGGSLDWNGPFLISLNYFDSNISIIKRLPNPFPATILNGNGTLIPIEVFRRYGLYNTVFTPHYHADSEIVLRAQKFGYNSIVCFDAVLINEFDKKFRPNGLKLLFHKKSDYYFPSLLYFYFKYNPTKSYLGLIRQYFHFFQDNRLLRKIAYYYRKYVLKYPKDKL